MCRIYEKYRLHYSIMQPIALQIRRDTDARWTSTGTILRPGEQSYATDTNILKVGDGINIWTNLPPIGAASTSPLLTENFMVAGGDQVTLGTGKALAYSYDGLAWNSPNTNIFQNGLCTSVAWNGSTWLAGGVDLISNNALIASSPDGIRWTADVSGDTSVFKGGRYVNTFAWNGSLWVAGAIIGSIIGGKSLATSADGKAWVEQTSSFDQCYTVASNGTMFVAGGMTTGSSKLIAYSYDGVKWVHPPIGSIFGVGAGLVSSVAWNGLIWVACGRNDAGVSSTARIATSPDGINWTQVTLTPALNKTTLNSVAWNGSLWIATGQDYTNAPSNNLGVILSSPDGTTWTNITSNLGGTNPFAQITPVAWNGSRWLIGGYDSASTPVTLTSIDTITWTPVTTGMGGVLTSIAPRRLVPIGPVGPLLSLSYYLANNTGANTGSTAISVIGFNTPDPANSVTGGALYMNYDMSNGVLTNTSNISISVLVSGQVTTDNTLFDLNRIQPCLYVTKNSDNIVSSSAINFNGSSFSTVVVLKPAETITIRYSQTMPYDPVLDVSGVQFLGGQFSTRITFTQISSSGGDRSFPSIIRTSLIPDKPSAYDLGSTGFPFRSLHVTGTTLYLGDAAIKETGGSIQLVASDGTIAVSPTGPTGAAGSAASQGTTIIYGAGIPDPGVGDAYNTYIQDDAAIIYSKTLATLGEWEELTAATQRQWSSVASSQDGQFLAAVAGTDSIYINNNYGDGNWEEIQVAGDTNLNSIACNSTGQLLVVSNPNGFIYTNNSFGQGAWTVSDRDQQLWHVTCSSDGALISAVSTEGLFASSADSGTSWTYRPITYGATSVDYVNIPTYEFYYTASVMGDTIYYTNVNVLGQGWTRMAPYGAYSSLKGFYMAGATNPIVPLYVATLKGVNTIKYTPDLGVTWEDLSSSQYDWTSIAAGGTNAANIFAVTADDGGHIMYSKGGVSGTFKTMPNPDNMQAAWGYIACNPFGTYIAITDTEKYIWRADVSSYTNPGDQIIWISDGATAAWNSVAVNAGNYVLATALNGPTDASGGLYISSTNNFNVLTFKDVGSSTNNFTSVTVCGTTGNYRGAVVGIDEYIYISNDGDLATWTALTAFGKRDLLSISSVAVPGDNEAMRLVAVDTSGNIWISENTGVNWDITSPSPTFSYVTSNADGTILAATDNGTQITDGGGYVWLSTDSGVTWLPQYSSELRDWRCISCSPSGSRIVATAADNLGVYLTLNTGLSWSPIGPTIKTSTWTSIVYIYDAVNDTNIIAATASNNNYIYLYDGSTWTQESPPGAGSWTCIASSANGSRLLAGQSDIGSSDGPLYRYSIPSPWNQEINIGSVALYTPTNQNHWAGTLPTTIKEALDRLAYAMSVNVGPIT